MNGSPGDDPVIDIVVHGRCVYSDKIDGMVRQLSQFLDMVRLQDFMHSLQGKPLDELAREVDAKLQKLRDDARSRGWEVT